MLDKKRLETLRTEHLVETDWLEDHLNDSGLRIVDIRGYVRLKTDPDGHQEFESWGARDEYLQAHIPGALYLDWITDIVDLDDPVPAQVAGPEKLAQVFGAAGIGDGNQVVVYDPFMV